MQVNVSVQRVRWALEWALEDDDGLHLAMRYLAHPGLVSWPSDPQQLLEDRETIRQLIDEWKHDQARDFLDLSLFSTVLLRGDSSKFGNPTWWADHLGKGAFLSDVSWASWLSAHWVTVPVPVVYPGRGDSGFSAENPPNRTRARLIHFMVGHGAFDPEQPSCPDWVGQILGADCLKAVADAFTAARTVLNLSGRWLAYPLCPPGSGRVSGRSLGLPLALAALSAGSGHTLARHLFATGDIHPDDGRILKVGEGQEALINKAECAGRVGYRLFLIPSENLPIPRLPEQMEGKAVADLCQAWLWARLYNPGEGSALNRLEVALSNSEGFVSNCGNLPPSLIEWCAQEHGEWLDRIIDEIHSSQTLQGRLIAQLDHAIRGETANLDRAEALARLIPEGKLDALGLTPLSNYRWCRLRAKLASRSGQTTAARSWHTLARQWEGPAKEADPREFVHFVNQDLVIERHDSYTFVTKLPEEFSEILERQRQVHRWQKGVDYILGGLCGTVAQNFGYCGPGYLDQTRSFVSEAQVAFGAGRVPDYRADWQRQFNYLCYALMDAGFIDEAQTVLLQYLGLQVPSGQTAPPRSRGEVMLTVAGHMSRVLGQMAQDRSRDRPFMMATSARYLREACTLLSDSDLLLCRETLRQILSRFPTTYPERHPWQLFANNLGWVIHRVGNTDLARQYWQTSARTCDRLGETGMPMALLAITALDETGGMTSKLRNQALAVIESIQRSNFLRKAHFQDLLDQYGIENVLGFVRKHQHELFPFTYR